MLTCRNDNHDDNDNENDDNSHDNYNHDDDENGDNNDDNDDYRTSHSGNREGDGSLPSALSRQLVHDPVVQREVNAGLNIITSMTIELL